MFKKRKNEPNYAKLWDMKWDETHDKNQYGKNIETVSKDDILREVSLHINNDGKIGENPNRYKQHGFYFNADNCIGCHACESACSEKNDVPSHLAFRSVGFVEGGTYPNYQRLNISMACNHCDNPVCLKGCPTRAYTKFAEYGAVLQDSDICFGCGYCTWVCPYNAPQLDPVEGVVSKCNMCVDRLEVGLKPACVAACLGNALDFGVVENVPKNREQAKVNIPGFPTNDITHPNIRFQQTKATQRDMTRPDGMPIKYHKQDNGEFKSTLDTKKHNTQKQWGLKKLFASHENAHAIFTLLAQITFGGVLWIIFADLLDFENKSSREIGMLLILIVMLGFGLFKLTMHLGKPHFLYRGFYNLRLSPVSREIAGVSLFFTGLISITILKIFNLEFLLNFAYGLTLLGFSFGSYYMYKLYRIPARPFWNHWQTGSHFYATVLSLGSVFFAMLLIPQTIDKSSIIIISLVAILGVVLEIVGHIAHAKHNQKTGESQASNFEQTTTFGKTHLLRNGLLLLNLALLISLVAFPNQWIIYTVFITLVISQYLSRIMFYAVVIPTTMPGAFFWKNDKFKTHATEVGLDSMPQVGVIAPRHHKFEFKALLKVIKENTFKDTILQIKSIIKG